MHDVFMFSFRWEFFFIWNANHKIDNSHLIWRNRFTTREHNTDKRDLRKLDCPELSIGFRKRCCTYVNTGHCRKIHQDTGLCVLCIWYVCVRACVCAYVCAYVCVFVLVCPLAWERYTQDYSTRTLSLAHYILYGVKLKPNTHQNETVKQTG